AEAAEEDTAVSMDLGAVLAYQGRADEAVACFRRVLAFDPGNALAHANLLMCLNYLPGLSGRAVREAHEDWARGQAEPLRAGWQPHGNNRDPGRRLRLGYVSADFGRHPVGFFLARVLPAHDREAVEVFCYSCRAAEEEDDLSRRLAGDAGHWRRVGDLDDDALAERVREDGIDILVDLAGHSAGHRLGLFARKPAPVQVSWLGYFATTGMSAFDATIMDADTVPPGAEAEFVEPVVRLPRLRFCYDPPEPAPAVAPPPCLERGHITFGSFNNLAKLSPAVIALWARVLHAVPASRLVLKWMSLADPLLCRILVESFSVHGIAPERIEPRGPSPHARMLAEYGDVDIALDPFPFGGGLTSCEALWMGVPVVTLPGERPASRQTLGFLRCLGLGELAADSAGDYVVKAAALAADPARLAVLRQDLRGRMAASSLCDGPGFARDLEAALRGLWTEWCARGAIV
ncbi:MAG: hypothetical protein K2Q10_10725, partial [Rhodospirillales bacterium]|nr:hypothetical protein [Rhodospirillales bacterium]